MEILYFLDLVLVQAKRTQIVVVLANFHTNTSKKLALQLQPRAGSWAPRKPRLLAYQL